MTAASGREEMERHYRSTTYWARTPRGAIPLRIDLGSAALAALLAEYGADDWAFLTAWNPGSVPAGAESNRAAQRRLLQRLRECAAVVFPGRGVPDGVAWEPEQSWLALDLSPERALALGGEFGQIAILAGRGGAPARLLWTQA